jgi:hypothetical protein
MLILVLAPTLVQLLSVDHRTHHTHRTHCHTDCTPPVSLSAGRSRSLWPAYWTWRRRGRGRRAGRGAWTDRRPRVGLMIGLTAYLLIGLLVCLMVVLTVCLAVCLRACLVIGLGLSLCLRSPHYSSSSSGTRRCGGLCYIAAVDIAVTVAVTVVDYIAVAVVDVVVDTVVVGLTAVVVWRSQTGPSASTARCLRSPSGVLAVGPGRRPAALVWCHQGG